MTNIFCKTYPPFAWVI